MTQRANKKHVSPISRPQKMRNSASADEAAGLNDPAAAAAAMKERRAARKRSLVAADSMRSLHGHKEGPGRETMRATRAERATACSIENSEVVPRPPPVSAQRPPLDETVQKV